MPNSKIVNIAHDGSYPSEYGGADGQMHCQLITFEDGTVGQAKSKNPTPPYSVGDEVEYTFDGEYQGKAKVKVKKLGMAQGGGFRGGSGGGGFTKSRDTGPGQMVGSSLKIASDLMCAGIIKPSKELGIAATLAAFADKLCQESVKLKDKYTVAPAPAPAQTQAPQSQGYANQPNPTYQQPAPRQQPLHTSQGQPVYPQSAHAPANQVTNVPLDDDDDIPF